MSQNILSYVNRSLKGYEIKEWIHFHTHHDTEYSKIAQHMCRYMNIRDDLEYTIDLSPSGTGCGETKRYYPNVIKKGGDQDDI